MNQIGTPLQWGVFFALVAAMLALDLGVFHRRAHAVEPARGARLERRLGRASRLPSTLGLLPVRLRAPASSSSPATSSRRRCASTTSSSSSSSSPTSRSRPQYQHRVLFWGILGRPALLRPVHRSRARPCSQHFHWLIYVFGGLPGLHGHQAALRGDETEVHPEQNPVLRLFRRFFPLTTGYHGERFFVARGRPAVRYAAAARAGGGRGDRRGLRGRLDPGDLRDHARPVHRLHLEHLRHPRPARRCTSCSPALMRQVPLPEARPRRWCWSSSAPRC